MHVHVLVKLVWLKTYWPTSGKSWAANETFTGHWSSIFTSAFFAIQINKVRCFLAKFNRIFIVFCSCCYYRQYECDDSFRDPAADIRHPTSDYFYQYLITNFRETTESDYNESGELLEKCTASQPRIICHHHQNSLNILSAFGKLL